ncbi:MAG: VOC family protein [Desulfuromonadaceae bacterium]|nr:VOC family protein [Desulfuromonadaceae bacterium]
MSFILTLGVTDLERSDFFYRHILGFRVERFHPATQRVESLIIREGNVNIVMLPAATLRKRHPAAFEHLGRTPFGAGMSLDFQVENLTAIARNLKKHMLPILYELEDEEHNRREIWLYDPSGYLVTLCQEGAFT